MKYPSTAFLTLCLLSIMAISAQAVTVLEVIDVDTGTKPARKGLFGKVVEESSPAQIDPTLTLEERYRKDVRSKRRKPLQFKEDLPGENVRYQLYRSQATLARSNRANTEVVIDIEDQRAYLLVNGLIGLETPISTARTGKITPNGTFSMTERIQDGKISNIYDVEMPYWMRLDQTAYGVHAGDLPGYPASAGCIRLPNIAAEVVYNHTQSGTKVRILDRWSPKPPPAIRYASPKPVNDIPKAQRSERRYRGRQPESAIPYAEPVNVIRRIEI